MSTKYVCEIDGSIFSSEDDLVKHIRNKFVTEFKDKKTDVSEVYDALNEAFPDWQVTVEDGVGWLTGYVISLSKDKTTITQYFGNEKSESNSYYTYKNNPDTIIDLIKDINWKMEIANRIVSGICEIGDFDDVYCSEFSYGYSSDEHRFTFCFKLKHWDDYESTNYYPWGRDSDEENFVNDFKKYFVTKIEGEISSIYDDGYFVGYSINGISLDGLISRAKKVRFEIIE